MEDFDHYCSDYTPFPLGNNKEENPPIHKNLTADKNVPITFNHGATYIDSQPVDTIAWFRPAVYQSKHRDPHSCDTIVRQVINFELERCSSTACFYGIIWLHIVVVHHQVMMLFVTVNDDVIVCC